MNNTYKRELIVCESNGEELTFETVTEVANYFKISYFQAYRAVNDKQEFNEWKITKKENPYIKRSAYIPIRERKHPPLMRNTNDGL